MVSQMVASLRSSENVLHGVLIAANCGFVVGLVLLLKVLFQRGFTQVSSLTTLHFILTGLVAYVLRSWGNLCGASAGSVAPWMAQKALVLAFFRVGSLVFSNSSLLLNSVTLFEVLRFTTIPLMCGVDYLVEGRAYSGATYAALAGVVGGSALATVTE
eukprot:RCo023310